MTTTTVETFVPYNEFKSYLHVNYVGMERTEQGMFADIMIVEYRGKEYELYWDEAYSYYVGEIAGEKGYVL